MALDTTRERRSKWGLFSHKGDKDAAATTHSTAPDSTYGGSEVSATSGNSLDDNNNRNTHNHNNNNTNNNNRNHTPNNHNENSQTVTTTTTTTTTTTSGPGSNTSSSHNADLSQRGNNSYDYENTDRPSIPAKSTRRDHSPSIGTNYSRLSPDAHPSALGSNPANSQYGPHSTTLQGLKTAAAGIHGAGETLRGTVNSAVDRRFNEQPATIAAHQQIAEQGRREIETGRLNHSGSTATQNSYHPNVDGMGKPRKGILRKKVDDHEGRLRPVGF